MMGADVRQRVATHVAAGTPLFVLLAQHALKHDRELSAGGRCARSRIRSASLAFLLALEPRRKRRFGGDAADHADDPLGLAYIDAMLSQPQPAMQSRSSSTHHATSGGGAARSRCTNTARPAGRAASRRRRRGRPPASSAGRRRDFVAAPQRPRRPRRRPPPGRMPRRPRRAAEPGIVGRVVAGRVARARAAQPKIAALARRVFQRRRREAAADAVARGEQSPGSPLARSPPASPAVSREGSYKRPASFQRASKKAAPDLFERAAGKPRAPPQCSVATAPSATAARSPSAWSSRRRRAGTWRGRRCDLTLPLFRNLFY